MNEYTKRLIKELESEHFQRRVHKATEKFAQNIDSEISDFEKKRQADRLTTFLTFNAKIMAEIDELKKQGKYVKPKRLSIPFEPEIITNDQKSDVAISEKRKKF